MTPNFILHALAVAFTPVVFLLPGWLISRRIGSPAPLLTGFFASAMIWFHLVLVCDVAGWPLNRLTLIGSWAGICLGVAWFARRAVAVVVVAPTERSLPTGTDWIWVTAAAVALLSIATRALIDPLSGWDNRFRWDYIGRVLLARGNLGFYPPVTTADFETYAWCDGIPPLVPLLNAWLYLTTGISNLQVTAVRIVGEAILVGMGVFGASREWWGKNGGWAAVGLLATSSLVLWGIAIGQETALLTLSLVSLLWFLERYRRDPQRSTVVWAAVAAGLGALSREYGLAFGGLGLVVLWTNRATRRGCGLFALVFAAISLTWYARNWAKTGNPLFPQTLGGMLPGNHAFEIFQLAIKSYWELGSSHVQLLSIATALTVTTGGALMFGLVGIARLRRSAIVPTAAAIMMIALWGWSVSQTAGGISYSLRVLTPVAAIAALLGGWIGATPLSTWRRLAAVVVVLVSLDAARRAWLLPVAPLSSPFSTSFTTWRETRDFLRESEEQPAWDYLARLSRGRVVVVDSPGLHASLVRHGVHVAPFFSPVAAPCFDETLSFPQTVQRLRLGGVKLITLLDDPVSRSFVNSRSFLRTLQNNFTPAARVGGMAVYDLDALRTSPP